MKLPGIVGLSGLLMLGSATAFAGTLCLSSGPVENIAQGGVEDGSEVEFKLAARFFTMNILNNTRNTVKFEAKVFQIDGLGDFEGGTWPSTGKPKIERFYGKREPVVAMGAAILTADLGDDPEEHFGYEAQIKVTAPDTTRGDLRNLILVTGHARKDVNLHIIPELRLTNREWTPIRCQW